jgi:hypothetical protein
MRYSDLARMCGLKAPSSERDMRKVFEACLNHRAIGKWSLDLDDVVRIGRTMRPSWDAVFLSMLESFRREQPGRHIVLKTPTSEQRFFELKDLLEHEGWSVRFLYCVRHPFNCYLSWKYRSSLPDFHETRVVSDPYGWSGRWLDSITCALEFHFSHPRLLRIVRFEDILDAPERHARELCEFVGVANQASEMVELESTSPNSSFETTGVEVLRGGILDVRGRKQPGLDDNEREILQAACRRRAAIFHYDMGEKGRNGIAAESLKHRIALANIPTMELLPSVCRVVYGRLKSLFSRRSRNQDTKTASLFANENQS